MPTQPLKLLKHWLDGQNTADLPHIGIAGFEEKTLRHIGYECAAYVGGWAERAQGWPDVLLLAGLQDFARTAERADEAQARVLPTGMPAQIVERLNPENASYRVFVTGAIYLIELMQKFWPAPVLYNVDSGDIAWAEASRLERLGELQSTATSP